MAGYGGQLVALDVNNTPIDIATPLMDAAKIGAMNTQNAKDRLDLSNQVMQRNALMDYYRSLNQPQGSPLAAQSNPATTPPPTPSMLIAQAADSADTPEKWDAAMNAAAKNGATDAQQFIGRFTPKLKAQVVSSYGTPAPQPSAPPPTGAAPVSPLASGGVVAPAGSPLAATLDGNPNATVTGPDGTSYGPQFTRPAPAPAQGSPLVGAQPSPGMSPLARLGILNPTAASNIANLQARLHYQQSGDINDLRIDPQAMASVAKATQDMSEAQKTRFALGADYAGRLATAALQMPEGPERDAYIKQGFAVGKQRGFEMPDDLGHAGPVTNAMLQHGQTMSMTVDQYMKTSGQEAGNEARAKQPYELQQIGARAAAEGNQNRITQAADVPNKIAVERAKFVPVGTDVFDPLSGGAAQPGGTSPAGVAAPAAAPGSPGANKFAAEVPAYAAPIGNAARPGVVFQGKTPSQTAAENAAVDQYKETATVANAAADVKGQLGTMKAQLDQGLNTNALAPQKAIISSYINALAGPEQAKAITGIDPAQADVFNKDATRLGFALSRTLGAREAMQTIQAAIKANPNMMNTTQGNQTVIGLLDASADRQLDAQKYADAYYQKNGHYVGAESTFNQKHPAAEYLSKVVPYSLPSNRGDLQPNVTYKTAKGPAVWDADNKHFVPVQ